jgi:hypothetical protein
VKSAAEVEALGQISAEKAPASTAGVGGLPAPSARWWADLLDYRITDEDEVGVEISGPTGAGPTLVFLRVPEAKSVKNRLHIDVSPTDREQEAELGRLYELGAERVDIGQGDEAGWVVLSDPKGNEFCLLGRRQEPWPD